MSTHSQAEDALRGARHEVFWLDDAAAPAVRAPLSRPKSADCVIVGGGFTGLWSALIVKEKRPDWDVVVLEGVRIAWGASGRNGGFCDASVTHGLSNGLAHFPDEIDTLEQLGVENLTSIEGFVKAEQIDCDLTGRGTLDVAVEEWQMEDLAEIARIAPKYGYEAALLDATELRKRVDSPTYKGGLYIGNRCALVNPARLAWGLAAAAERRGIEIFEGTMVASVDDRGREMEVRTAGSVPVRAPHVILGTNAFPPLLSGIRSFVLPVYDYALVTEPLTGDQREAIRWSGREGLSDAGNLFHYYRMTADNRILFGGYDAIYHYGNATKAEFSRNPRTFALLARHFYATFPQLRGIGFTHAWGGAIDTCSRFAMFFGQRYRGKVHYAMGFTGLGVGASRFAAQVLADRVTNRESPASGLRLTRTKPVPFPPEPLRKAVVEVTRRSLMAADRNQGQRNRWLRLLDRVGVGFDS